VEPWQESTGELMITFSGDKGLFGINPCSNLYILGVEGGEEVFVAAFENLRVCGPSHGDPDHAEIPRDPENPDYLEHGSHTEYVFENGEPEFARAVANTAVHELGHIIAKLESSPDSHNFMFEGNLPMEVRTRESERAFWSQRLSFDAAQTRRLVCAIQTGNISGGDIYQEDRHALPVRHAAAGR
jgi:hypothetical protein